jgi:uncharacterized protein (TIGR02147 family)
MINIFDYLEYREYLRDYYQEQKRTKPFFSYRFIGNRVGMDSSFVIKVLQSGLHISPKRIESFIKLLNLNAQEAEYFEALVHFCRAKTQRQRAVYFDKLFAISVVKAYSLEAHHYEFFRKWYYSAVWAIINCSPFYGDFAELAGQCLPPITVRDAKRAIRLLERLGLIKKEKDGAFRTTDANLTTGQKWRSPAIEGFQREMLRLASESVERFAKEERDLSTVTLCVDEKIMPEIREHIRQFRSSLVKLVNSHAGSTKVYQLNVQLFPLSGNLEKKS